MHVALRSSAANCFRWACRRCCPGEHEDYVPLRDAEAYVQAAKRAGDRIRLILIPSVGHFEIASHARRHVAGRIGNRSLLDGRLPP